jgi:hypothetical protein
MAKRKDTTRRKSATMRSTGQDVLDDLDYASSGGWRTRVNELIYLLRVLRGHWLDEANELEMLVQTVRDLTSEDEQAVLHRIINSLASVRNHAKGDLTEEQRSQLKDSLHEAIVRTRQRLVAIPDEQKRQEQALLRVKKVVEAHNNPLASTPEASSKTPAEKELKTVLHHKQGNRSYSSDCTPLLQCRMNRMTR